MTTETPLTGLDLKLRRTAERVKLNAVAREMGISPSRLSRIELPEPVTDRMAKRYVDALERAARPEQLDGAA